MQYIYYSFVFFEAPARSSDKPPSTYACTDFTVAVDLHFQLCIWHLSAFHANFMLQEI